MSLEAVRKIYVPAVLILALSTSCSSSKNKKADAPPPGPEASWSENMRSLMDTLTELLPIVHSPTTFQRPENRAKIVASTEKLNQLSHNINRRALAPEMDPSVAFMAEQFAQDLRRTQEALSYNQMEYARISLRNITGYCIACHTRHGSGLKFPAHVFNSRVSNLSPLEKAEYYTATRQFDLAADAYQRVLADKNSQLRPLEWEQAARQALALEVRVKRSPEGTDTVVKDILQSPRATASIKEEAIGWQQSLNAWKKEDDKARARFAKMTPPQNLKRAEALVKQAERRQRYPMDRSGDIEYLRASDILHTLLSQASLQPKEQAQALYLAGLSTEALRDLSFWTLHETLYETCIDRAPKTAVAKRCFKRLENSILSSYSGSSGTQVPDEVARHLRALKQKL